MLLLFWEGNGGSCGELRFIPLPGMNYLEE